MVYGFLISGSATNIRLFPVADALVPGSVLTS